MNDERGPLLNILLVEDSLDDEALLLNALKKEGIAFRHDRVWSEQTFRTVLQQRQWDILLTDFNLPAFSASDVLAILQESGLDIPCIVVSGFLGEETAVSLLKAGASDFVPKTNLSRLAPAIRREVGEARSRLEKRLIERSLRRNEQLLAKIASTLGEGIVVTDEDGVIIFINPEAQRLLGWQEHEIFNKNLHQTIHYLKQDGAAYPEEECPVATLTRKGIPYRSEDEVFVRKDGTMFPVSYIATPMMENGKIMAVVTAFQDITRRKEAERNLKVSRRQLRELSNFLQTVREEDRTRIAREMHDELGQALTALKMDVAWMLSRIDEEQEPLVGKAENMMALIDSTVDSVRRIAANLRPGLLDDLGLAAAVEWLVDEFRKRTQIGCELHMSHEEFDSAPDLCTTVFRLLQEATTNVARHAHASHVKVTLDDTGDAIELQVEDDGQGFDPQARLGSRKKSFGLLGMRERVTALGGSIELTSQPGHGTRLWVSLPKVMETMERDEQ